MIQNFMQLLVEQIHTLIHYYGGIYLNMLFFDLIIIRSICFVNNIFLT